MDGLLAEAAHEGFRRYLASKSSRPHRPDPVDDLRDGWDLHIEFGVDNPALYLLMYGDPTRSRGSAAAVETASILRGLVEAVASAGRLRIDIGTAAAMIHSTGIGVALTLIDASHRNELEAGLSTHVREAVLASIVTSEAEDTHVTDPRDRSAVHASALRATLLHDVPPLSAGEALLLDELLTRISASATP